MHKYSMISENHWSIACDRKSDGKCDEKEMPELDYKEQLYKTWTLYRQWRVCKGFQTQ